MSQQRIDRNRAGWVDPKKLPTGANGRALCRWCSGEVPRGRRTFCSTACVEHHRVKTDTSFVRTALFRRDKGVCAVCAVDTKALRDQCRGTAARSYDEAQAFRRHYGAVGRVAWWDADHIIPVVEGGGECDLSNYRTLCIPCHKQVTADLAARRAHQRRAQQQPNLFPQDRTA